MGLTAQSILQSLGGSHIQKGLCFPVNKLCLGPENNGASYSDWHKPGLLIKSRFYYQMSQVHYGAIVLVLSGQERMWSVTSSRWADCSPRLHRVALLSSPDNKAAPPKQTPFAETACALSSFELLMYNLSSTDVQWILGCFACQLRRLKDEVMIIQW